MKEKIQGDKELMINRYRRVAGLLLTVGMLLLALPLQAQKQPKEFTKWPTGSSPQEIGRRVAERLLEIPHSNFGRPGPPPFITYPEVATWYGALTFAQLSGDKDLDARLIKRFQPIFAEESNLIPVPDHVDRSVFGAVPLEIYIQTKEQKYLDLGKNSADKQWEDPTPDGLSSQTRYWIDDMYMIIILQLQAYRATGDSKYLDRAAL
jgi:unsaturated rhamnogalacturonyl hydrolase